jgi:hypothetical protein
MNLIEELNKEYPDTIIDSDTIVEVAKNFYEEGVELKVAEIVKRNIQFLCNRIKENLHSLYPGNELTVKREFYSSLFLDLRNLISKSHPIIAFFMLYRIENGQIEESSELFIDDLKIEKVLIPKILFVIKTKRIISQIFKNKHDIIKKVIEEEIRKTIDLALKEYNLSLS